MEPIREAKGMNLINMYISDIYNLLMMIDSLSSIHYKQNN